ncbi:unnamed protein product [Natator depressus]
MAKRQTSVPILKLDPVGKILVAMQSSLENEGHIFDNKAARIQSKCECEKERLTTHSSTLSSVLNKMKPPNNNENANTTWCSGI